MTEHTEDPWPYHRILYPTDLSGDGEVAFAHALKLALATKSRLEIVHVNPNPLPPERSGFPHVRDVLVRWGVLPEGATHEDVRELHIGVRKVTIGGDNAAERIIDELAYIPSDFIVMATHRRKGLDRWLHKEVATKLSRLAHVPTLFVPYEVNGFVNASTGKLSLRNILLPVDSKPDPWAAIQTASQLTTLFECTCPAFALLHVGRQPISQLETRPPQSAGGATWQQIHEKDYDGDVVKPILDVAADRYADLIVATTEGHHGFLDALRGSTTERILQGANCPVLTVPSRDATTST